VTSLVGQGVREQIVNNVVNDLQAAGEDVRYPGAGMLRIREESLELGVVVDEGQWEDLLKMG